MRICRCTHPEKKHCEGSVPHSTYKDAARMVPRPKVELCLGRHCEEPLCDCSDFREATS